MPTRVPHDPRDPEDVLVGHGLMKEVAHRVDEDHPGRPPLERLLQLVRNQPDVEAKLEGMPGHATEALRERLRVAVLAPGADLRATADGVPGRVGPLDLGFVAHGR